jgi:hypothetical protein
MLLLCLYARTSHNKSWMTCQYNFTLALSKERHVIYMRYIQLMFEKSRMFNSFLSLQKTYSHQVAWWIYRQIDHRCALSIEMSPFCWWSLMKWCLMSICFVLVCWTRLFVILIALSLSHSKGIFLKLKPKSFKVDFIHSNWAQQLPALTYSASAVDSATVFYFLDDHDTSDLPSNWHVPLVLFLFILHPP